MEDGTAYEVLLSTFPREGGERWGKAAKLPTREPVSALGIGSCVRYQSGRVECGLHAQ